MTAYTDDLDSGHGIEPEAVGSDGIRVDERVDAPKDGANESVSTLDDGEQASRPDVTPTSTPEADFFAELSRASAAREQALLERLAADQGVINAMQMRIETLQGDQIRALLGPVVTELANLHASVLSASERDYERLGFERVRKEFALMSEKVAESLDVLGAESLDVRAGDPFDARLHTAVRQVAVADAELHGTVDAVVRQGFTFDPASKPILHARVVVRRHETAAMHEPNGPTTIDNNEAEQS
jgi:molecular chaperone GrpE (heat shock protein)